jgi:hypothetical protein
MGCSCDADSHLSTRSKTGRVIAIARRKQKLRVPLLLGSVMKMKNIAYFILAEKRDKAAAVIEGYPDNGPTDWKYHKAQPLLPVFPSGATLVFSSNFPDRRELRDFIPNPLSALIVSPKAQAVIKSLVRVHAEFLPVTVCDHEKKPAGLGYAILNLLGGVPAIDMEKSRVKISPLDKTQISYIDHLVLDTAAIGPEDVFFRASMRRRLFIIREDVKAAFEQAGLTGWKTYPCDGWNGMFL